MLALLISSHANGLFSSRKIERATHRDVAIRYRRAAAADGLHDALAAVPLEQIAPPRVRLARCLEEPP